MSIFLNNKLTNIVNNPTMRKLATNLTNPKAMLPVMMLELGVTGGRTYQAYKRGGVVEARERIIDESLSALVWFGIITWLNQGFSKIIGHKGIVDKKGLPEINIDIGKDILRDPMKTATSLRPSIKNKISGLKFTKIVMAALTGIYLSGVVLPKFYQSITEKILRKENKEKKEIKESIYSPKVKLDQHVKANFYVENSTSNTIKPEKSPASQNNKQSFNGAVGIISTTAHLLENNPIAKLLTIDGGLFMGRAYSARNRDERIEYIFRDITSSFFYLFSTPLTVLGLSKVFDKFSGKNTDLDQTTANFVTNKILGKIGKDGMKISDYNKYILGEDSKQFLALLASSDKKYFEVKDFLKVVDMLAPNTKVANKYKSKAMRFILERPKGASKDILTLTEMRAIAGTGTLNAPNFLNEALSVATNGLSQNPQRFIPYKELDKIKFKIKDYAQSILEYAQKTGQDKITPELLTRAKNRNFVLRLTYTLIGMAISTLFLSTLIPKMQYRITKWRTGSDDFPGIKDIEKNTKSK